MIRRYKKNVSFIASPCQWRNVPDKCVDAAGHAEVFLDQTCATSNCNKQLCLSDPIGSYRILSPLPFTSVRPSKFPCNANPQHVQHGYSTTIRDPRCQNIRELEWIENFEASWQFKVQHATFFPCADMIQKILPGKSALRRLPEHQRASIHCKDVPRFEWFRMCF